MRFESEIVYRMPMTLNEWYIKRFYESFDIKEIYKKEVSQMEVDVEKLKAYYADLLAKREEAIALALADKDRAVAERFELVKEQIAEEVEKELIEKAEEPYKHDIELCKSFLVEEQATEEVVEEGEVVAETTEYQGE